jgi:hypothetical protein
MVILIDTNIVFDVISKRQPHYQASNQILCLCRRKAIVGAVAYHTIANVFYMYGKAATPLLREVLLYLDVHGATGASIQEALRWGMNDWEDAMQAAAAQTAGASFIVTRNVKDFKFSRVPAVSPKEFLKRFHPG